MTAMPQTGAERPPETAEPPGKPAVPENENRLEVKYRETLAPVELLIVAWDFGGALAALEKWALLGFEWEMRPTEWIF